MEKVQDSRKVILERLREIGKKSEASPGAANDHVFDVEQAVCSCCCIALGGTGAAVC